MLALMMWRASLLGVASVALVNVIACHDNPTIDGKSVAATASTCTDVCNRLVALCGFAPDDCTDADGGGVCDTTLTPYLDCFASAASCQAAWDCPNATTPDDDASTDDASTDDASTDDGSGDDGSTDDASGE